MKDNEKLAFKVALLFLAISIVYLIKVLL